MSLLSDSQRDQFEEQGYLLLRGLLEPSAFAGVIRRIEQAVDRKAREMKAAGVISNLHEDAPLAQRWALIVRDAGGQQVRRSWDDDVLSPELFELMSQPPILNVMESLIGPNILATGIIAIRPKIPADKRTTVLWHQDSHYFGPDTGAARIITVWLPLRDTDLADGCMQVIPGSHRWGLEDCEWDDQHHAHRPVRDPEQRGEVVICPMQAGDALFFTNLTYHRSGMNNSDHIRWSVDLRYHAPDLEYERRSAFMPGFVARSTDPDYPLDTWATWRGQLDAYEAARANAAATAGK